jgi:hypothetical protein
MFFGTLALLLWFSVERVTLPSVPRSSMTATGSMMIREGERVRLIPIW